MDLYHLLAAEFFSVLDGRPKAPHRDRVSGIMKGEMAVLRLLVKKKKHLNAGEISRELGMTSPRLAAVLNSLEKKKLICRQEVPEDKRRIRVLLTDAGSRFCEQKRQEAREDMARLLAQLGEADARELIRLMRRISKAMAELESTEDKEESDENKQDCRI